MVLHRQTFEMGKRWVKKEKTRETKNGKNKQTNRAGWLSLRQEVITKTNLFHDLQGTV